jgi:hypothetical protein
MSRNGKVIQDARDGHQPFHTRGDSQIGDIYTARFTSAGRENCKAVAKVHRRSPRRTLLQQRAKRADNRSGGLTKPWAGPISTSRMT